MAGAGHLSVEKSGQSAVTDIAQMLSEISMLTLSNLVNIEVSVLLEEMWDYIWDLPTEFNTTSPV